MTSASRDCDGDGTTLGAHDGGDGGEARPRPSRASGADDRNDAQCYGADGALCDGGDGAGD